MGFLNAIMVWININFNERIMSTQRFNKRTSFSLLLATIAMVVGPLLQIGLLTANAAGITVISDTMTDQAPSAKPTHTVVWTSSGSDLAGDTVAVDFAQANFTPDTPANWLTTDFTLTDQNHSAQAPLAVGASPSCTATDNYTVTIDATNATFTITFCSSWVTSTTPVTFVIDADGPATGGFMTNGSDVESSLFTMTYSGTNTTSGQGAVVIETDADVNITATVASTLVFNVSDNTIGFGTLDASAARYANGAATGSSSPVTAHTFDVATNATSGFTVTINGATLTSGANTITGIGNTNTASSAGTEQFGVRYTESGGTGATVTAPYAASGYAFATSMPSQVASSTGPTATATYDAIYLANISGTTEAGAYATTLDYVATGHF